MITYRRHERGQALILVVFGMIGLIMMTALAIDGGNVYSDRRHAQNAADTSVLAAGLAKIRGENWYIAGLTRAADNGYDNNASSNVVNVYECTDAGSSCSLPPPENFTDANSNGAYDLGETYTDTNGNGKYDANEPKYFMQVTITSHVQTYLARVLGITQLTNNVQAVARAIPPYPTPWYTGKGLVAVMPSCKPLGWNADPFTISGGSVSFIGGSGVFVNSNCDEAFTSNNNATMDAVGGICVVGTSNTHGADINPPPTDNCGPPMDVSLFQLPSVGAASCPDPGQIYTISGHYVATPGYYDSSFPGNPGPAGTLLLQKGIYCLNNGLSVNSGGWTMTTDVDGNGTFDGSDGGDEGVLLYVPNGGITFNGGSHVDIGAINKLGTDPRIKGYLIYMPPTNSSTIKLTGNNGSQFIGTVLAPASLVTLEGSNDSTSPVNYEAQIIGYSVEMAGNGYLNITYNQSKVASTWSNHVLQLYR